MLGYTLAAMAVRHRGAATDLGHGWGQRATSCNWCACFFTAKGGQHDRGPGHPESALHLTQNMTQVLVLLMAEVDAQLKIDIPCPYRALSCEDGPLAWARLTPVWRLPPGLGRPWRCQSHASRRSPWGKPTTTPTPRPTPGRLEYGWSNKPPAAWCSMTAQKVPGIVQALVEQVEAPSMPSTLDAAVRALETRLAAAFPTTPIAWPNVEFSAPPGACYLQPWVLWGAGNLFTMAPAKSNRVLGIYQVNVYSPLAVGAGPALDLSDLVRTRTTGRCLTRCAVTRRVGRRRLKWSSPGMGWL